jgi:hypothetical protein
MEQVVTTDVIGNQAASHFVNGGSGDLMKIGTKLTALAAAVFALAAPALATNLVVNGDFETTTLNGSYQFGSGYPSQQLAGWTTSGYNFVFQPGAADTTGATGQYGSLQLWGPNNGSNNGLPATSPTGGNFVGADGAYGIGAIEQVITGLVAGQKYDLSFWWGGAQQQGYTGPTTEQWEVSLGNETHSTAILDNANHGFTGWQKQTFTFTATGASEILSFLAHGTPDGVPPFSLLDGVSMQAQSPAPEPASWALMIVGFGVTGVALRRRRSSVATA